MEIEFKNVSVAGIKDDGEGIVEAIVSVTGIVDNVRDIIKPGAYEKTLAGRKPKGVWHHSWTDPVSKTLDIKELMPGDPMLPKKLPNGQPWPKEAGALWVKTQFNLDGARGRQAYSDVKFFDDEQEWSIGYNVPTGGSKVDVKSGIRNIDTLDLYEYSPVLFGAMPSARTQGGVKEAQMAFKSLGGYQFEKSDELDESDAGDDKAEEDELVDALDESLEDDDLDPEEYDLPVEKAEKSLEDLLTTNKKLDPQKIRTAIKALQEVLEDLEDDEEGETEEKSTPAAFLQLKALEYPSLMHCVAAHGMGGAVRKAARRFDGAQVTKDVEAMEEAADEVLTALEAMSDEDDDGEKSDEIALVGSTLGALLTSEEEKSAVDYLKSLDLDEFSELDSYVSKLSGEKSIKALVEDEATNRLTSDGPEPKRVSVKGVKPKPKPKGRKAKAKYDEGEDEDIMPEDDEDQDDEEKKTLIPLEEFKSLGLDMEAILNS